jgi:hypothetical protein
VAAIQAAGGDVLYDYEFRAPPSGRNELPGPDWLCRLMGVDYFADVAYVSLYAGATDHTLARVGTLTALQELWLGGAQVNDAGLSQVRGLAKLELLSLYGTSVTDAGLAHVGGLSNLKKVYLIGGQTSDEGYRRLHEALPECEIVRD